MGANQGKKVAANALIVLLSFLLIRSSALLGHVPWSNWRTDLAGVFGELIVYLIVLGSLSLLLIQCIAWRVKMAEYTRTNGRQALAIFLIGFCAWQLAGSIITLTALLVRSSSTSGALFGILVVYCMLILGGLYICIGWLRKLRHSDQAQATGTKS